jgi:uncharacterized cupredoxin-like copper-binding protein
MLSSRTRIVPMLIMPAAVAIVLGCQMAVPAKPVATPAAARIIELQASDFAFEAPENLTAGLNTIRLTNMGQEPHHAQLLRLNDGVTFDQLMSTFQQEGEGALRLVSLAGGAGAIDPSGTSEVTLDLQPGTYVLACFIAGADGVPHLAKGMLKPLVVNAGNTGQAAPEVQGTFTARDFAFDMPETLPAGKATFKVVNNGPQFHELNILKIAPGKAAEDVLIWAQNPTGAPPFQAVGGMNGLGPDGVGYMTVDLQPGTYLAICNIPDPASGHSHAELGMIRKFTVK